MKKIILFILLAIIIQFVHSQDCNNQDFIGPNQYDTYFEFEQTPSNWQNFNVHDPTVNKDGIWYYMYNTDVGMGYDPGTGALKRKSKDLINWEFLGQAFNGIPESARQFFLKYNPDYTNNGIWAPFLIKYKNEYRLYYSAPGGLENTVLAFIGYATSNSANGPWTDMGEITSAIPNDTINAIDPTVVIDSITGKHWMAYGSYQTGVYIIELDAVTGGLKNPGDRGVRIAGRIGGRHAAIEGPEITYRNGWYYLFVSYDWLEDFYNIRVGRSKTPEGPYYDIKGNNMADYSDNYPLILEPYRFKNHDGWQGTGHCGIYCDSGNYFMFHQARPTTAIYNMVLHTRKIFWINGWPVVSPERYANTPQCKIEADSIAGKWEHMQLTYSKSVKNSEFIELAADNTFDNNQENTWELKDSLLLLKWSNGILTDSLIVSYAWDWENRCTTIIFTGINNYGTCRWGKKINQEAVDRYNKIVPGAAYQIRNHFSNKLLEVQEENATESSSVKQGADKNTNLQAWRILDAGGGYSKLVSVGSNDGLVLEIQDGSNLNGKDLILGSNDGSDKQLFKILNNNNGYFTIYTKISSDFSCVDLEGFSVLDGANIFQWESLGGLNQLWRFMRIDSIDIDTTDNEISTVKYNNSFSGFTIYPNPGNNGNISIKISGSIEELACIKIINTNGIEIATFSKTKIGDGIININLQPGIYLVYAHHKMGQTVKKLLVY